MCQSIGANKYAYIITLDKPRKSDYFSHVSWTFCVANDKITHLCCNILSVSFLESKMNSICKKQKGNCLEKVQGVIYHSLRSNNICSHGFRKPIFKGNRKRMSFVIKSDTLNIVPFDSIKYLAFIYYS